MTSGIELDLKRGVGRADLGDAADRASRSALAERQALEEGVERHLLVAPRRRCARRRRTNSVLVMARLPPAARGASGRLSSQASSQRVWTRPATHVGSSASAACSGAVVAMPSTWSSRQRAAQPRERALARRRPRRSACRAANRRRAAPCSPDRACVSKRTPEAARDARAPSPCRARARSPFAASSALMRDLDGVAAQARCRPARARAARRPRCGSSPARDRCP